MQLLQDKICLITGCSRGIGAATMLKFIHEGATVYANIRDRAPFDEMLDNIGDIDKTKIRPMVFDITDAQASKDAIMQIKKESGRLDVLVNNAGIMKDAVLGMIDNKLMTEVFNVNVFSVINLIQLASKLMIRQKSGSIINLSSIVGSNGSAGQIVYSASKGAVLALTKSAAKELSVHNIRVNCVAPGMIDTDLFRQIGESRIPNTVEKISLKRLGKADEVGDLIAFLASDAASYITGQSIGIDGLAVI